MRMTEIKINGIVQGIGFRPFIYRLALELDLKGYVLNSSSGVEIVVDGSRDVINTFINKIRSDHPAAAIINDMSVSAKPGEGFSSFIIKESLSNKGATLMSPDLATCPDCFQELKNPGDHRYNYPFINCTNCGPRFSIIESLPYDRPATSMKTFPMCSYCKREYKDPLNRRFHAQPVACSDCGPELVIIDGNDEIIDEDPIRKTIELIKEGKIVGIKGIGGFHICCDATNTEVLQRLRKLKYRPHKPFAIMIYPPLLQNIVEIDKDGWDVLRSPVAPILILPQKKTSVISPLVAPDNPYLGIFLPYAPVHHLLLSSSLPYLIMTSGNRRDEPIASEESELKGLCDFFLTHNRPIINRSDDSIILPTKYKNVIIRRSRGYIPKPITMPLVSVPTLGAGAELKLTFALSKKDSLFLSPYLGNSGSRETREFYLDTLAKYKRWFKIEPELVACDLQPDFMTTRYAESLDLPLVKIQHHEAHVAAVMAEYQIDEPVIGIAYDGTGWGTDNAIWGGEIFVGDYHKLERYYHLNYMPLPGGDRAIKHPIRIAFAYLTAAGIDTTFLKNLQEDERILIQKQLERNFNVFNTSSLGRLFDSVSAMLGLYPEITFEAQSAMALEFLTSGILPREQKPYSFNIGESEIDIIPLIRDVAADIKNKVDQRIIASRFHRTVVDFTVEAVNNIRKSTNISKVVLSGGVMQNRLILEELIRELRKNNFTVFFPTIIPANDGSIALGQVVLANKRI